ncbi:hypothetical protein [Streptomyces sp. MAR4 CNX-425]|uniref:hypothetical protein n=1 Tax=Streptomyces sp. MAR4 CNX-425 TaxID=3406343 RepID=UPI003B508B46
MPGTHAAVLPRVCRAVVALLAGLAIVALAPVFACVDAGSPHHEGGESLRGSTLAVTLSPEAYADAEEDHRTARHRTGSHLDAHGSHADCRDRCCEPAAALPGAVLRDDSPGSAAHPVRAPDAPSARASVTPAGHPVSAAAGPRPAARRAGPVLLRLVCVSRT